MLKNAYFLAKIGADTAENEQHFAEILPIGRRVADRCPGPEVERKAARAGSKFRRQYKGTIDPGGSNRGGRGSTVHVLWPRSSNSFSW